MKETIRGYISYIMFPKNGNFEFTNGTSFSSFIVVVNDSSKEDDTEETQKKTRSIKCSGNTFPIFKGADVRMEGEFEETEYGKVFKFSSLLLNFNKARKNVNYVKSLISEEAYNLKLLKNVRRKYGLTGYNLEKTAKEMLIEALEAEDIERLKELLKPSHERLLQQIIELHKVNRNFESAYEKLNKYGLKTSDVSKFLKRQANINKVVETIEKNPYKLINAVGISYRKADMIYGKNGGLNNSKKRIMAAIFEALRSGYDEDGNCYLTEDELLKKVFIALEENYFAKHSIIDIKDVKDSIAKLVLTGNIVLENNRYYLKDSYMVQEYLKNFCKKAIESKVSNYPVKEFIERYEEKHNIKLGREQKQSVYDAVNHKIHIITGGAGVGKTSSLACILAYFLDELGYKEEDICLVAPTGKAAQRMTESVNKQLGSGRKPIIANTIHSTLEVVPSDIASGKLENFHYNINNKMNCKVVVCDETSMNDYKISYALLSALKDDCRIIFLGDIGQLEPVGAGFFFRDAIESGIPTTYLNEIHRQKGESSIISISQAIRNENMSQDSLGRKIDFSMIELQNNFNEDLKNAVKMFMISVEKVGIDQTMMITPLRETEDNNKLDSKTLSIAIQKAYLPDVEGEATYNLKSGYVLKVGSKIIITKNNWDKGLINGAIGYVTDIDGLAVTAEFDGEEKVLVGEDLDSVRLGYAITVHKSQGSDWKNVIYICSKETSMNTKNLVYTAVTRAKEKLVIFGNKGTVEASQFVHPKRKNSVLLNEKVGQ